MVKKKNGHERKGRILPRAAEVEAPKRQPVSLTSLSLVAFTDSMEKTLSKAERFAEKKGADGPTSFNQGFLTDFVNAAAKWQFINHKNRFNRLMESVEKGMTNKEVIDLVSEVQEKANRKMNKTFQGGPK